MDNILVFLFPVICIGLILFIRNRFVNKVYPQKTNEILESVRNVTTYGFSRTQHGYQGVVSGYGTYIYASTSIEKTGYMKGDMLQIWLITSPESGQLKGLNGFNGKYLVAGKKPGYAMVGFTLRYNSNTDCSEELVSMSRELAETLVDSNIKPYPLG